MCRDEMIAATIGSVLAINKFNLNVDLFKVALPFSLSPISINQWIEVFDRRFPLPPHGHA